MPALIKRLWDDMPSVRSAAAEALGRIGPDAKQAVPALIAALSDDEQEDALHSAAAEALGLIGPAAKAAVPILKKRLEHPDPYVRVCAALALWKIDKDKSGAAVVTAGLNDRNFRTRVVAAEAAWHLDKNARAVPLLLEVLREAPFADPSDSGNMKYMAARALGRIGPPAKEAAPVLRELLQDEDPFVRMTAAAALKAIEKKTQP